MSHHQSNNNKSFFVHPFEIALGTITAESYSSRIQLVAKLIGRLSAKYKVGCLIIQNENSTDSRVADIEQLRQNGAWMVTIFDHLGTSLSYSNGSVSEGCSSSILENDFVFVDGYSGNIPITNVCNYFEDIDAVQRYVCSFLERRIKEIPLYGLVLAGGKSMRMKKDKSLLEYHGKSQASYCFDLLSMYCDQVYVSNQPWQTHLSGHKILPQMHDAFLDIGPLGGILTALTKFPEAAWLVLACDLPFINGSVLKKIVCNRNPFKFATVYRSAHNHAQVEPLCAIYEPKARFRLLESLGAGMYCPRHILSQLDVHRIDPDAEFLLNNINDPVEYKNALQLIKNNFITDNDK